MYHKKFIHGIYKDHCMSGLEKEIEELANLLGINKEEGVRKKPK